MSRAADLAFAHELADLARPLALRFFRAGLDLERKAADSLVTLADREIERVLRERIGERLPDDGILGEEHGRQDADRARVWVVDPSVEAAGGVITDWSGAPLSIAGETGVVAAATPALHAQALAALRANAA